MSRGKIRKVLETKILETLETNKLDETETLCTCYNLVFGVKPEVIPEEIKSEIAEALLGGSNED